jgi:hypothetical protein
MIRPTLADGRRCEGMDASIGSSPFNVFVIVRSEDDTRGCVEWWTRDWPLVQVDDVSFLRRTLEAKRSMSMDQRGTEVRLS